MESKCTFGAIPDPRFGARGLDVPEIAWCLTHNCSPGTNGCLGSRIAELEAALRPFAALAGRPWHGCEAALQSVVRADVDLAARLTIES